MGTVTTPRSDLSKILLVASDQAYDPAVSPASTFLAQYPDSTGQGADAFPNTMPQGWSSLDEFDQWRVFIRRDDLATGFGATVYRKPNAGGSADYIVAMQGTRGPNIQDWSGNLIYGWDRWGGPSANVAQGLLSELLALADVNKIHFTGQSLGGALAEYALYDYAVRVADFPASDATLTTFNGLGGLGALSAQRDFDPSFASPLTEVDTAHFYITNDLVSRLGGGHLNANVNGSVNEYELSFSKVSGQTGLPERRDDFSTIALDVVAAHRIESGFYAGFNRASSTGDSSWPADFTGAKAKPIQNLDIGALARTGTYLAWLTNQDGALTTDTEALARLVAGIAYALAYGNPSEVKTLTDASLDHYFAATELGVPRPLAKRIMPKFLTALATSPSGIAARLAGLFLAGLVESAGDSSDVVVESGFVSRVAELVSGAASTLDPAVDPAKMVEELETQLAAASGGEKSAALYVSTGALLGATAVLAVPSLAESAKVAVLNAILEVAVESAQDAAAFGRVVVREVATALRQAASDASDAFSEAMSELAKALVAAAIEVSRDATDLIADAHAFVADVKASVTSGLTEVGRSIANAHQELVLKFADTLEWGVPIARQTLDSIIESFTAEANADQAGTAPSFEQAIDALKLAAQLVAVRNGAPREDRGRLCGRHGLERAARREQHGPAQIEPHDDAVVVTSHEGFAKPDPRVFRLAAKRAGATLDGAWVVGESAERADIVVQPWPSDHRAVVVEIVLEGKRD